MSEEGAEPLAKTQKVASQKAEHIPAIFVVPEADQIPEASAAAEENEIPGGFIAAFETPPRAAPQPDEQPDPMSSTTKFVLLHNGRPIRNSMIIPPQTPGSSGNDSATPKKFRIHRRGDSFFMGTPPLREQRSYSDIPFVETFILLMKTLKEGPGKINGELTFDNLYKNELFRDLFELRTRLSALHLPHADSLAEKITCFIKDHKDEIISHDQTRQDAEEWYFILLFDNGPQKNKSLIKKLYDRINELEDLFTFPEIDRLDYTTLTPEEYTHIELLLSKRVNAIENRIAYNNEYTIAFLNAVSDFRSILREKVHHFKGKLDQEIDDINRLIDQANQLIFSETHAAFLPKNNPSPITYLAMVTERIEHFKRQTKELKEVMATLKEEEESHRAEKHRFRGLILVLKGIHELLQYELGHLKKILGKARKIPDKLQEKHLEHLKKPLLSYIDRLLEEIRNQKAALLPEIRQALLNTSFFKYLKDYGIIRQNTTLEYFYREECDADEIYVAYAAFKLCPDLPKPRVVAQQVQIAQQMGSPVFSTPLRNFMQTVRSLEEEMREARFDEIHQEFIGGIIQMKEKYEKTQVVPESFDPFITDVVRKLEAVLKNIPKDSEDLVEAVRKTLESIRELLEVVKPLSVEAQLEEFHKVFCQDFEEAIPEEPAPLISSPIRPK